MMAIALLVAIGCSPTRGSVPGFLLAGAGVVVGGAGSGLLLEETTNEGPTRNGRIVAWSGLIAIGGLLMGSGLVMLVRSLHRDTTRVDENGHPLP